MENSLRKKVCIVDDEGSLREIYSVKFRAEGFDVVLAVDGKEGLRVMREEKPDIVLLDLQMPVMDGFEVLEERSKNPILSAIPVIILSNVDDERAFKAGEYETSFYIVKSLSTPQKVVDITRNVLSQ